MTDTAAYSDIRSVTAQQGTYEWYSPAWLVEAATAALGGIELDPATTAAANQLIGAERIYTIDDDGLAQPWVARSVFVGPPFNLRHLFAEKLVAEYQAGHVASAIIRTVAAFDEDLGSAPNRRIQRRLPPRRVGDLRGRYHRGAVAYPGPASAGDLVPRLGRRQASLKSLASLGYW